MRQGVKSITWGAGGGGAALTEPFRILTTLLQSLLVPLSFLLLARLSTANYLSAAALVVWDHNSTGKSQLAPTSGGLLSFPFLDSIVSTTLYALASLITAAAFVHGLTARLNFSNISQSSVPELVYRPRLYTAWIILCTLQLCVGLGIQGRIGSESDSSIRFTNGSMLSRILLFVGLHETMHFWSKNVVKPVVDSTIMGFVVKEERWIERVGMAMSFGMLWWWKLRDEVDSLVVVVQLKTELQPLLALAMMVQPQAAGGSTIVVAELIGWWLYYLTIIIGTIRLLKGGMWVAMILLFQRAERNLDQESVSDGEIDDKV